MIKRGDVLVVIDPKYDKDLGDTLRRACLAAGRPNALGQFHPAFPDKSVRIDPMKNFTRDTEHASRVAELLGNDPDDNFVAFCWRTMHAIDGGLLYIEERPSLKKMRYYIEAGPEELLEKVLTRFFNNHLPGRWESHVQALQSQLENASRTVQTPLKTGTPRQAAMVQFYHENVPRDLKAEEVTGLLSVGEHSREHLGEVARTLDWDRRNADGEWRGLRASAMTTNGGVAQGPCPAPSNEMEFSGERSESAATTG